MIYTDDYINAVRQTGRQITASVEVQKSQQWNIDFSSGDSMVFRIVDKPAFLNGVYLNDNMVDYNYNSETGDLEIKSQEGILKATWSSTYTEEKINGIVIHNDSVVPGCSMKQLILTLKDVKELSVDEITSVSIGVISNGNTYWFPFGKFYVDKTDSGNVYNEDTGELTVIAYDPLIKTMTEIYVPESEQDNIKNAWDYLMEVYRNLLANGLGFMLKGFDKFKVFLQSLTFKYGAYDGKTYRDFLNDVAGACCAIIQFEYYEEEETGEVYHNLSLNRLQPQTDTDGTRGIKLDDCSALSSSGVKTIKKVVLQGDEKNVEITGTATNGDTLAIANNILIAEAIERGSTTAIENYYKDSNYGLIDLKYSIFEATTWGLPWLNSGYFCDIETKDGTKKKTVVLSWSLELRDCGLTQSFSTTGMGTEQTDYNTGLSLSEVKSEINRLNTGLQLKVSKGDIISEINQTPDGVTINGDKINLNGTITANGSFQINKSGTMSCDKGVIGGWTITPEYFEKTLDSNGHYKAYLGTQRDGDASDTPVYSIQEKISDYSYQYMFAIYMDGSINTPYFHTGANFSVNPGSDETKMIEIYPNCDDPYYGGMYIVNSGLHTVLIPNINRKGFIGTTSGSSQFGEKRWYGIYLANNPNVQSDRKLKDNIKSFNDDSVVDFIMGLKPCSFELKDSDGKRPRMGFIAQEVAEIAKSTLGDLSLYEAVVVNDDGTTSYYDETAPDEKLSWGLKYEEFIAPLTAVIQLQQKQIDNLTDRIIKLEERLNENN